AEDREGGWIAVRAPEGASLQSVDEALRRGAAGAVEGVGRGTVQGAEARVRALGGRRDGNVGRIVLAVHHWDERDETAQESVARLGARCAELPVRLVVGTPRGLGIRGGALVQIVRGGGDYDELAAWRDILVAKAVDNAGLTNIDSDYHPRKPQLNVAI